MTQLFWDISIGLTQMVSLGIFLVIPAPSVNLKFQGKFYSFIQSFFTSKNDFPPEISFAMKDEGEGVMFSAFIQSFFN